MKQRRIRSYTVQDAAQKKSPFAIENFIVSESATKVPEMFLKYPHMLEGVVFSICIKGTARLKINLREYDIKHGTVATILPNCIIELLEHSDDFLTESLFFSFDFISELPFPKDLDMFERIRNKACLDASDGDVRNLIKYHAFIVEQYSRENHLYRTEVMKSLLFALLAEIGNLYSKVEKEHKNSTRMERMATQFASLVYKHYREERNINFYADKMHLTPKYLTSTIKKITGKSILLWINEAVITTAKSLLKSTDMTVLQISEELNFSDSSLFCRFFKRYTTMTPMQYREWKG